MNAVPVRLSWLTAAEGGRTQRLPGSPHATVAHFPGEELHFSVVFEFPYTGAFEHEATMKLLFPDRMPDVVARLQPGARLEVCEGRRLVARCEVTGENHADSSTKAIIQQPVSQAP